MAASTITMAWTFIQYPVPAQGVCQMRLPFDADEQKKVQQWMTTSRRP
jgi:hypothetical protein